MVRYVTSFTYRVPANAMMMMQIYITCVSPPSQSRRPKMVPGIAALIWLRNQPAEFHRLCKSKCRHSLQVCVSQSCLSARTSSSAVFVLASVNAKTRITNLLIVVPTSSTQLGLFFFFLMMTFEKGFQLKKIQVSLRWKNICTQNANMTGNSIAGRPQN